MGQKTVQWDAVWTVAAKQHGLITRRQLMGLGFGADEIQYRIERKRLHPVRRGVYAVGRPELTQYGEWMAAVLASGPGAVASHRCAGGIWKLVEAVRGNAEVTVPAESRVRKRGIRAYRRDLDEHEITARAGIPVTTPVRTIIDLGTCLDRGQLEAAVNDADKRDLLDPETLRLALERCAGCRGVATLREILDRHAFVLTDSELERLFLPIARAAGLGTPLTQQWLNGFRVDFYWPQLGLVVETDGLRYHRTPSEQARDRLRDQTHTAAGLTPLRFTHAQVRYERGHVRSVLQATVVRLRGTTGRLTDL